MNFSFVALSLQWSISYDTNLQTLVFQEPGKFEIPLVVEQLRYCGIVETVKIRKASYPIRYGYADFIKRYECKVPGNIDALNTVIFLGTKT